MSNYRKLVRNCIIALTGLIVLLIICQIGGYISRDIVIGVITAAALNSLSFFSGMYLIIKGLQRPQAEFLLYVMGGMVARLFILLPLILISASLLNLNFYSFILVFFVLYVIFLVVEIVYLLKFENRKIGSQ